MKLLKKLPVIFILLLTPFLLLAQDENKQDLYFNFTKETELCPYESIDLIVEKEKGTQFNLCGKAVLLHPRDFQIKILHIKNINSLKFHQASQIDSLVEAWKDENDKQIQAYYGGPYPFYGKNQMFNTFIVVEDKVKGVMSVYPVMWVNDKKIARN